MSAEGRLVGRSMFLTLILLSIGVHARAGETVVRQGSNADLEFKILHSPVAVEAPADEFTTLPIGKRWNVSELGHFYCDGVTIEKIELRKIVDPFIGKSSSFNAVHVSVQLRARAQEDDMLADLEFSLIDSDRRLVLGKLIDIKIEAGGTQSEGKSCAVSTTDRASWFESGKHPKLLVTMTTRAQ